MKYKIGDIVTVEMKVRSITMGEDGISYIVAPERNPFGLMNFVVMEDEIIDSYTNKEFNNIVKGLQ